MMSQQMQRGKSQAAEIPGISQGAVKAGEAISFDETMSGVAERSLPSKYVMEFNGLNSKEMLNEISDEQSALVAGSPMQQALASSLMQMPVSQQLYAMPQTSVSLTEQLLEQKPLQISLPMSSMPVDETSVGMEGVAWVKQQVDPAQVNTRPAHLKPAEHVGKRVEGDTAVQLFQKPVASMNTATAIAGLKPWSREWVFQGSGQGSEEGPVKAVFSENSNPAGRPAEPVLNGLRGDGRAAVSYPNSIESQPGAHVLGWNVGYGGAEVTGFSNSPGRDMAEHSGLTHLASRREHLGRSGRPEYLAEYSAAHGGISSNLSGADFLSVYGATRAKNTGPGAGVAEQEQFLGDKKLNIAKVMNAPMEQTSEQYDREKTVSVLKNKAMPSHDTSGPGFTQHGPKLELTAHVVKGAMSQDRMSSETLRGISSNILNLSADGGGEIRVRLKPEELGELHIRVITKGSNVGLQIRASDESAKKVLEESMSHLKESLASQKLNLGKVEFSVTAQTDTRADSGLGGNAGQSQYNTFSGNQQGGGHSRSNAWDLPEMNSSVNHQAVKPGIVALPAGNPRSVASATAGRLDVMA